MRRSTSNSDYVVKVLEATRKQGKYWEALEALLATQSTWAPNHSPDPDLVWRQLEGLGLDLERVRQDMNAPDIARNLAQDIADAKALNEAHAELVRRSSTARHSLPIATISLRPGRRGAIYQIGARTNLAGSGNSWFNARKAP